MCSSSFINGLRGFGVVLAMIAGLLAAQAETAGAVVHANGVASHRLSQADVAKTKRFSAKAVHSEARALPTPEGDSLPPSPYRQAGPTGPPITIPGAPPTIDTPASAEQSQSPRRRGTALWPYSYSSNPNRQIGKIWFDVKQGAGTDWRSCSGTAINSGNKSMVMTAGHCVFSPDPDGNGRIETNRYWHEGVQFCPGYEYGCKLGTYYARKLYTTSSWFSGVSGRYNFKDDVGIILVNPRNGVKLVDAVGAQGSTYNQPVSQYRRAFGYPVFDNRWPARTWRDDMYFCDATDSYNSLYGAVTMACTMTGGSSGGPWIIKADSSWRGLVNSVNSHKLSETTMSGPYFDNTEYSLWQTAANG